MSFELNMKENGPINVISFVCNSHEPKVIAETHFWKKTMKVFRPRKRPFNECIEMVSLRCPICKTSEDYEFKGIVIKESLVKN
jgi:hypothetical protein